MAISSISRCCCGCLSFSWSSPSGCTRHWRNERRHEHNVSQPFTIGFQSIVPGYFGESMSYQNVVKIVVRAAAGLVLAMVVTACQYAHDRVLARPQFPRATQKDRGI